MMMKIMSFNVKNFMHSKQLLEVAELIKEHNAQPVHALPKKPVLLKGRHRLRRNLFNMLAEGWELLKYKLGFTKSV
jgi:hypothetical protein